MMSLSLRPFKLPERRRFLKDQKRGFKSVNISFTNPVMPHLRMSLSQRTQRETEKTFGLSAPPDKPKHLVLSVLSELCVLCVR